MNFIKLRESKGLNQTDIARMLGTTSATISNLEKGLPISNRLAVRIELLSGGKIRAQELTFPGYAKLVAEEEQNLASLLESYKIWKQVTG